MVPNNSLSFRLEFPCSNNVVEYEALVIGLISALQIEIQKLRVQGDSKLVIHQINGVLALKENAIAFYQAVVQKLIKLCLSIQFEHVHDIINMLWIINFGFQDRHS